TLINDCGDNCYPDLGIKPRNLFRYLVQRLLNLCPQTSLEFYVLAGVTARNADASAVNFLEYVRLLVMIAGCLRGQSLILNYFSHHSDATRTKETLKIMQEYSKEFSQAEVHFMPSFYSIAAMDGQTAEHLQKIVCQYSRDEVLTVMCMGHNRGWEEAASMFSGFSIELKTCNAALLEATGESWKEVSF
ncbi:uncharacterized protein LOC110038228, partial [Phalaenopsis equestris]|uniref:uncharacterized protein LOC110038228 n=1 Tax=Phalaenopsis equestris TaxID=78828 RepID=UPI0009E49D4A